MCCRRNYRTVGLPLSVQLFIAIIDNFFKIIEIISVIGDKFGKIIEVIFVCTALCILKICSYAILHCNIIII